MSEKQYTVSTDTLPNVDELSGLFRQTAWAGKRTSDGIEKMLRNTSISVVVRDGDTLVGFGRALSDGIYRALLDDIIVDESHRGKGIGQTVVRTLMEQLADVEEVFLNTGPDLESFYGKCGFTKSGGLTMKG